MRINLNKPPAVIVEYDCRSSRASKRFENAYAARAFYMAKLKQGRKPAIRRAT